MTVPSGVKRRIGFLQFQDLFWPLKTKEPITEEESRVSSATEPGKG